MRHPVLSALAAVAGLLAGSALAQPLNGTITIDSDEADWEESGQTSHRGNVVLNAPDFTLTGDRLTGETPDSGMTVTVIGTPATLVHRGGLVVKGKPQPAVSASASELRYDTGDGWITLEGNASLIRGNDRMNGHRIRYNLLDGRVQASGRSDGQSRGQVRIVIEPPPGAAPRPDTPAPEAPTP